ncbi:MAG: hypothetical protein WCU90_15565 [Kiritimatiellia bacterium]
MDWNGTLEGGVDPDGADSGSSRVWRSGGWGNDASSCRSASRSSDPPSALGTDSGFRLVRTLL